MGQTDGYQMASDPRLRLSPLTGREDPDDFADSLSAGFASDREPAFALLEQMRFFLESAPRPDPWGSYLAWHDGTAVATCSFKSAPDEGGAVEIAYFTFPAFEGRGFAKAMILELVRIARQGGASLVTASTLQQDNASNRALRRQGFGFAGEAIDPDDGPIWRWERRP